MPAPRGVATQERGGAYKVPLRWFDRIAHAPLTKHSWHGSPEALTGLRDSDRWKSSAGHYSKMILDQKNVYENPEY